MKYCEDNGHCYQHIATKGPHGERFYMVCIQCGQLLKFDVEKIEASGEMK